MVNDEHGLLSSSPWEWRCTHACLKKERRKLQTYDER